MGAAMNRRHLLALPAGLAGAMLLPVRHAAAASRTIGWIAPESRDTIAPFLEAFKAGLLAVRGGDEVRILDRYATGGPDSVANAVNELQQAGVSVLVTQGAATTAVARIKPAVPVVFGFSADPVAAGVVQSLARPGGNFTGVTFMSVELNPKRIGLVRAALPDCRRIGLLSNTSHFGEENEIAACQRAVEAAGVSLAVYRVANAGEIQASVARALDEGIQALVVLPNSTMVRQASAIAAQCQSRNVPMVSGWASIARAGALFTYGPNLTEAYKRVAHYVMRVLGGAAPSSLPVEQPTILEMVVNLRVATALGLKLPPSLLAQANEIIE